MTHSTTPHTQTPDRRDIEPDQGEQTPSEGAQTGTNRGPQFISGGSGRPNTEPPAAAHQGSTTTRTPEDKKQGITSHTADEESSRQQKVVKDRPDAQAGVNHNR